MLHVTEEDLIDYHEAATMLGITYGAVSKAIIVGNLTPIKKPGKKRKLLKRRDVCAYGGLPYITDTASSPRTTPTPSPLSDVSQYVAEQIAGLSKDLRGVGSDTCAAVIAGRIAITQTAMGVPITADPKWLRASYTR